MLILTGLTRRSSARLRRHRRRKTHSRLHPQHQHHILIYADRRARLRLPARRLIPVRALVTCQMSQMASVFYFPRMNTMITQLQTHTPCHPVAKTKPISKRTSIKWQLYDARSNGQYRSARNGDGLLTRVSFLHPRLLPRLRATMTTSIPRQKKKRRVPITTSHC